MSKKSKGKPTPLLSSNTLLAQTEKQIEASLTPENRENYLKVVVSGMRVLLDKGPDGLFAQLKTSKDPVADCAYGAVTLVGLLNKQARGTIPYPAIPPAAVTLMLHGLDFAEKAKLVTVDKAALVRAMRLFTNRLFEVMKITPAMLQHAAGAVKKVVDDPASLEQLRRRAGTVKDPNASVATDVAEEVPVDAV